MITEILYQSDILNGILSNEDFEFLRNSNAKQKILKNEIESANIKKNSIIEQSRNIDVNSNSAYIKEKADSVETALNGANELIANLTTIVENFEQLEKDVIELVVKKDSNNITYEDELSLKEEITQFRVKQKELELENKKHYNIIEDFLYGSDKWEKVVRKETKHAYNFELKDNLELRVSEKQKRVYLPYTKDEVEDLLKNYPDEYKTPMDVIEQEFIADISVYSKHPVLSRFREAYSLSRNKEMRSIKDSLKFAMDIMFKRELNPTIIAAVKSLKQLETYIECLEGNKLENFKYFTIIFEVNPI